MYTIECLLVSFIFYSLDVRFIYYSLVFFFPCIPAGGTQVLVYTAGHTMWKASEKCYPSVKRAKHFIEPKKKKKKRGWGGRGLIQFELLHTFCVIQDNFENNYLFQTQNLHSSDFCSFSLHEFPLQIQLCSLNWFIENINNISYNKKWSIQKKKPNSAFVLYLEQKCNKLN